MGKDNLRDNRENVGKKFNLSVCKENLIYQTLGKVKDTYLMGRLKKSRGALFNKIIQEKAKENNIDLGIKIRK